MDYFFICLTFTARFNYPRQGIQVVSFSTIWFCQFKPVEVMALTVFFKQNETFPLC